MRRKCRKSRWWKLKGELKAETFKYTHLNRLKANDFPVESPAKAGNVVESNATGFRLLRFKAVQKFLKLVDAGSHFACNGSVCNERLGIAYATVLTFALLCAISNHNTIRKWYDKYTLQPEPGT